MRIRQVAGVDGNFGDMLNSWLWRELYPGLFYELEDGVRFFWPGWMPRSRSENS